MSRDEEVADLYGRLERLEAERDEAIADASRALALCDPLAAENTRLRAAIAPSEDDGDWMRIAKKIIAERADDSGPKSRAPVTSAVDVPARHPAPAGEGPEAGTISTAIAEQRAAARERAAVVADLVAQRFRERDRRGFFDAAGAWEPEDDEANEFDRIISEWIDRIERCDHLPDGSKEAGRT